MAVRTLYTSLVHDGRHCSRCGNRTQLFGSRDPVSGWCGYCRECNVQWYSCQFDLCLSSCSRRFSALLLKAWGLKAEAEALIRKSLGLCPSTLRTDTLFKHKLMLLHLLWLTMPIEWEIESDSEGEDERYEFPILRTLKDVFISSKTFRWSVFAKRHSFVFRHVTLLDAVSMYLVDSDIKVARKASRGCQHCCCNFPDSTFDDIYLERCWQIWQWNHRLWFGHTLTNEWFYADDLSNSWRRYWFFDATGMKIFWWCNGKRWFFEPVMNSVG